MRVATRIVSIVLLQLLLAFAVARNAGAAESKEAVDKLKTLSQSASAAYRLRRRRLRKDEDPAAGGDGARP